MSPRKVLPNRRNHEVIEFEHLGLKYYAGVGRYDDGSIGEVFLNAGKSGSDVQVTAHDAAVFLSLLLQYDCPIKTARHAVVRLPGDKAAGPFGALLDVLRKDEKERGKGLVS
jgi:hypothetical protein